MKRIVVLVQLLILFFVFLSCDTLKSENESVDSVKTLQTEVKIGNQIWMVKNLDVDTFRNGDTICEARSDEEWQKAGDNKQPAWCYYDNDPQNGVKYGKLYNWFAVVDLRGLAPKGWHVPSDEEWTILTDYLGGEEKAGKKMKSKLGYIPEGFKVCPNCSLWNKEYRSKVPCHVCKDTRFVKFNENDKSGINDNGFTGLPGGYRSLSGYYIGIGYVVYWWSSSGYNTTNAWNRNLNFSYGYASSDYNEKKNGFSVRCLRD